MTDEARKDLILLPVGNDAPNFTLEATDGSIITLSDYRGHMNVCLFFYPEDESPGCTRQLCAARDDRDKFVGADIERFGINPGSLESHQRFAQKNELDFPLLVDPDRHISRRYKCLDDRRDEVVRTVYLIDKNGDIAFRARGYPTTDELLEALA